MEMTSIDALHLNSGTQIRAQTDARVVARYAEVARAGRDLPPVTVFFDGRCYYLADGFHRVAAWRANGQTQVPCDVRTGSCREAILYAVGANATHGLPRSNADKRLAVLALLEDDEWSEQSDRWIAEKCAVSQPFVSRLRAKLSRATTDTEDSSSSRSTQAEPARSSVATAVAIGTAGDATNDVVASSAYTESALELREDRPEAGDKGYHPSELPRGATRSGDNGYHLSDAAESGRRSGDNGYHVADLGSEDSRSGDNGYHPTEVEVDRSPGEQGREGTEGSIAGAELDSDQVGGAPQMRRGRDGKWYPVRQGTSAVAVVESIGAKNASEVQREVLAQRVLEPLLRLLGDRIAGASLYSLEQLAMLSPVDQLAVLSFLVGGRSETLEEAMTIDRSAEVYAAMDGEGLEGKAARVIPELDPSGRRIPEHVVPAMAEVPVLSALLSDVRRARRRWTALVKRYETHEEPQMSPLLVRARDDVEQALRKAERALSGSAIPHAVCGYCKARGRCDVCRGAGWLGKEAHAAVPRQVSSSALTAEEMGWWLGPRAGTTRAASMP